MHRDFRGYRTYIIYKQYVTADGLMAHHRTLSVNNQQDMSDENAIYM